MGRNCTFSITVSYRGFRPALAAERIYASYAALERSISAALETYAKEGKLDDDLAVYAQYLTGNSWLSGAFC